MKKYRPSSGTEGMDFMNHFCGNCMHEHIPSEKYCEIASKTMLYDLKDKEYPSEWTYDQKGKPTCTKFQKWDWGDGYNGWNEPPEPPYEPKDPNQLTIFTIDDINLTSDPNQIDLLTMIKEIENEKL